MPTDSAAKCHTEGVCAQKVGSRRAALPELRSTPD
jgi:hypothetical protein